ncbi:hypothetical protein RFI_02983, partial [Reticulomyxa filosa]
VVFKTFARESFFFFVRPVTEKKQLKKKRFGDAIEEMDNAIGIIMQSLKENGVDDNTLTFFTSDNGMSFSAHCSFFGLQAHICINTFEPPGGIRMPALARWPDRITPGSRSFELTATYDIFTTILTIAGAPIPTDRIIDGEDMSPILFDHGQSKHQCLYIYGGTPGNGTSCDGKACAGSYSRCPGLYAIRCGAYKMHWVTKDYNETCPTFHDPPLLFNVQWDPSERHPIWPNDARYPNLHTYFENQYTQEMNRYIPVTNEILLGRNQKEYMSCCDPNSKTKYPQYPNCTCTPQNWNQSTCDPTCYALSNCGTLTETITDPPLTDMDFYYFGYYGSNWKESLEKEED